ncbi:hypothetical protein [Nevskia ramosa]|uniref:hypothetical protein n=1 Tax=Nevskia ramosa TaxID=64002 RepID=UPI002354959C|nr:hypothetical protein [Nevskia ramosa]
MSFILKMVPDTDPSNPRHDQDNVTQIWAAHRRYSLGDKGFESRRVSEAEVKRLHGPIFLIKKLYMYDHSGLTIKTTPFSCPWDSGQIGWVWITKAKLKAEYRKSKEYPSQAAWAESILEGEVAEYDAYLRGDVWGYEIVEQATSLIVDSCYGFIGEQYAKTEGESALAHVIAHPEQYVSKAA